MTQATSPSYRAYLVRCWRDKSLSDEARPWRFSVEQVLHERQRAGFGSLDALIAFLRAEFADQDESASCEE